MSESHVTSLHELLGVLPGVTSFIGGGGKTTMMKTLAEEIVRIRSAKILLTTSTHIYPYDAYPTVTSDYERELPAAFARSPIVTAGTMVSSDPAAKLTQPAMSFSELLSLCDYIFVEADGSRRHPLKAHREFEPVIDKASRQSIYLVGASAFYRPMKEVCHKPELYSGLIDRPLDTIITPELAAQAVNREKLADIVFINQCDQASDYEAAGLFASVCSVPAAAGSLRDQCFRLMQ